ncbi:hypothetical protein FACS1894201_00550 [Bacteroidia bacterium]|nr:hypothetical protein FACS1894201_00550 [Bacteroidia bacterium]
MSKSLLQTRILDKLEVIITQVDTMTKFGKSIPLIHLDILKSNIRMFYEQVCELERNQMQTTTVNQTVHPFIEEKTVDTPKAAVVTEQQAKDNITKLVKSIEEDVTNEFATEIPINFAQEESVPFQFILDDVHKETDVSVAPVAPVNIEQAVTTTKTIELPIVAKEDIIPTPAPIRQPAHVPDIFSSLQTIADQYKTPHSELNEALVNSATVTTSVNIAVKQIRDLKTAIGINEKFLFINDLFRGNMTEYKDTILALDEAVSREDAERLIAPLKTKYAWQDNTPAVDTFKEFLNRRFA